METDDDSGDQNESLPPSVLEEEMLLDPKIMIVGEVDGIHQHFGC